MLFFRFLYARFVPTWVAIRLFVFVSVYALVAMAVLFVATTVLGLFLGAVLYSVSLGHMLLRQGNESLWMSMLITGLLAIIPLLMLFSLGALIVLSCRRLRAQFAVYKRARLEEFHRHDEET